ncbi:hypothetical protein Tco_1318297 [Tanacetum coccineum]
MGDENPRRTLGDYSRHSHESYQNTIEVPNGNDLVPLRSDTIRRTIDQVAGGKLHDKNDEESWALLEDLALYDNESWNDPKDFAKPVKAISMPHDVPSTPDRHLIELENQVAKDLWEKIKLVMQGTSLTKQERECKRCMMNSISSLTRKERPLHELLLRGSLVTQWGDKYLCVEQQENTNLGQVKQPRGNNSDLLLCYNANDEGSYCQACTKPKRKRDDMVSTITVFTGSSSSMLVMLLTKEWLDASTEVLNPDYSDYVLYNQSEQIMSLEQSNECESSGLNKLVIGNIIPYFQYLSEALQETV